MAKIETCFVVLKELSAETGEHTSIGGAVLFSIKSTYVLVLGPQRLFVGCFCFFFFLFFPSLSPSFE